MSEIKVELKNNVLIINRKSIRESENTSEKYQIDLLEIGKQYKSNLKVTKSKDKNKILFFENVNFIIDDEDEIEDSDLEEQKKLKQPVIVVYTDEEKIKFMYCTRENAYKTLLKIKYKVLKISLNKRRAMVYVLAYIVNKYNIKYGEQKFYIDKELGKKCNLKQYDKDISKIKILKERNIYAFSFKIKDIIKDDSTINGAIRFSINIDGNEFQYKLAKVQKNIKNTKFYYNPIKTLYYKDYALHIRRGATGGLVFVKRHKEPIENTIKFKVLENKIVSNILNFLGNLSKKCRKKKVNLFFEKYSSKAEEGAYDLFLLFQKHKETKNYFIIDKESNDYEKIKNVKGVLTKFSLKYYWAMYTATNCIATEVPLHLNILRSNNKVLRKCLSEKKIVFLQHGITYLKCHGKNSTYIKGREGALDLIVAGSEKEREAIIDMLNMDEEQVLITGLPIFSKIKYKHINQDSLDYVAIMLTWKPYEEQLDNFEESDTYKETVKVYNMLSKYIDKNKIIVSTHPKALELMKNTNLKDSLWDKPYSEMLEKAKLLITDYSSVCYNSFYQGAGVIFYQPDIEKYELENGKLIPTDNEYIGKRVYNINELEKNIKQTIKDGKIDLNVVRTEKFENNYKSINNFSDGKNIDRIYEKLIKKKII